MTNDHVTILRFLGDQENLSTEQLCKFHEALNREADRVALKIPRSRNREKIQQV